MFTESDEVPRRPFVMRKSDFFYIKLLSLFNGVRAKNKTLIGQVFFYLFLFRLSVRFKRNSSLSRSPSISMTYMNSFPTKNRLRRFFNRQPEDDTPVKQVSWPQFISNGIILEQWFPNFFFWGPVSNIYRCRGTP